MCITREYHQHIAYTFLEPDLKSILLQWLCVPNSERNVRIIEEQIGESVVSTTDQTSALTSKIQKGNY